MNDGLAIRPAREADFAAAARLLEESGLPLGGLREHLDGAFVASRDGAIAGCVALELYGDVALLRSLVVAPAFRGQRLGERLTAEALALAGRKGVTDVYLLTETAAAFFPRFGFALRERADAPNALARSEEFQSACPASAVLMHARVSAP